MPEAMFAAGSLAAGALFCGAVLLVSGIHVEAMPRHIRYLAPPIVVSTQNVRAARAWLARDLERAGWRESPERVTAFAIAVSACLAVLGASVGAVLPVGGAVVMCGLGLVSGLGLPVFALKSAVARRRRRLEGELVPLLELFTLELSGGGSAVTALGSVTMQVQGELAADLRRLLIASQVAGSATFETRLIDYSERHDIRAVGSLATILAASREYGTGVVHGVRALATDLRRAQRRELIAHSRRALNQVLVPAAVGVLLPFLAILMFPAISALHGNLR